MCDKLNRCCRINCSGNNNKNQCIKDTFEYISCPSRNIINNEQPEVNQHIMNQNKWIKDRLELIEETKIEMEEAAAFVQECISDLNRYKKEINMCENNQCQICNFNVVCTYSKRICLSI